jgi:hypothetical protein
MTETMPHIIARLRFFAASEGGRQTATAGDHLGCIFEDELESFECRLLLQDVGPVGPGSEAIVPIVFLRPDLALQRLRVGSSFRLRELRPIATGVVESIAT